MIKYNCLNKIAACGTSLFTSDYQATDNADEAEVLLVRSAVMHEMEFAPALKAVARAGAGVNNIPLEKLAEKNVVVFNTPGANANAVKELVIAAMLLASRDIIGGVNWVKTVKDDETVAKLVEKEKSKFAGTEILGKKLGIIGLGAIGRKLAISANALGMDVYGCDPFLSDAAKEELAGKCTIVETREEIYKMCDFISVHAPLIDSPDPAKNTKGLINAEKIAMMKDGVIIVNCARDLLVNEKDMGEALALGKVRKYVTDFPNTTTSGMDGVITIPHLGASTEEAEDNCAMMAVRQVMNYLENGNIVNSVNYPTVDLGSKTGARIAIRYDAAKDMLAVVNAAGLVISAIKDGKRGNVGYCLVDCREASDAAVEKIKAEAIDVKVF